jgi:hypothetical protein
MASQKRPFTGLLLKAIHLSDAKPTGLRAAFGAPSDDDDKLAHIEDALRARYVELDELFALTTTSPDIWERRAKALIAYQFDIQPEDPRWWHKLTSYLAQKYVPGFSLKLPGQKKHGAPQEWDLRQQAELFADVEFLKKKDNASVRKVCDDLPKRKAYRTRWGRYKPDLLRRTYSRANRLRMASLEFRLILCGGDVLIPAKGVDPVGAAIERHALKI